MVVGILQVELAIDGATSLKDKRRVVRSLKDRLHREHMVSVVESDMQDDLGTAVLGIVLGATSVPACQSVLDRILEKVRGERDCRLDGHKTQILTGQ